MGTADGATEGKTKKINKRFYLIYTELCLFKIDALCSFTETPIQSLRVRALWEALGNG